MQPVQSVSLQAREPAAGRVVRREAVSMHAWIHSFTMLYVQHPSIFRAFPHEINCTLS